MAKSPSDAPVGADRTARAAALAGGPASATATTPASATASSPARPVPSEGLVSLGVLEAGVYREWQGEDALAELPRALARRSALVWIDVCAGGPELKRRISSSLKLHPLLAEDLVERDQRAKLEQVGEMLHLVMFGLGLDGGEIFERELDFVLDRRFLLTTHSVWWDPRATRQLRAGVAEVLARGTDFLLWALADDVIDAYFPILDGLGDEIDDLEDQVVARSDRALLERLFDLKRQLIQVRRVTSPQREMFNALSSREDSFVSAETRLYYRDAYDHLIRLTDELDTYRELASATLEAYLSTVNNNLSFIMKRLTGVTVVVAGVGAVGGIFGMSEAQYALRLDEGIGFWIVTVSSLVLAGVAVLVLRKIGWI